MQVIRVWRRIESPWSMTTQGIVRCARSTTRPLTQRRFPTITGLTNYGYQLVGQDASPIHLRIFQNTAGESIDQANKTNFAICAASCGYRKGTICSMFVVGAGWRIMRRGVRGQGVWYHPEQGPTGLG